MSRSMEADPDRAESQRSVSARRVALASLVGSALEIYDYTLYGAAAAVVFGKLFFPAESTQAATLAAFATITVGYVARPVGGIVMGHFGDRVGRKPLLVWSLTIAGGATFAIGLLPTYATVGILAPVLLVFMRLLQGVSIGGEWGAAVLMATEHAPRRRRNFYGSFPQMGVPIGLMLANGVLLAASLGLPGDAFMEWGWRIPFLLSAALIVVGVMIRLRLEESPVFEEMRRSDVRVKWPVVEVVRAYPKRIILALAAFLGNHTLSALLWVYMLAYAPPRLGVSSNFMLALVLVTSAVFLMSIAAAGILADAVGRRRVLLVGSVCLVGCAAALYPAVEAGLALFVTVAVASSVVMGLCYGPLAAMFSDLFPPTMRYSGISLSYQIGSILGGGIAPTVSAAMFVAWNSWIPLAAYVVAISSISLASIVLIHGRSLAGTFRV